MKVAKQKREWALRISAYTLAGTFTGAVAGALLAGAGRALLPPHAGHLAPLIGAAVAVLTLLVELYRPGSSTLQVARRQTRAHWGFQSRHGIRAAGLWGADLGLLVTTWFTFPGAWLVIVLALSGRSVALGATLFAAYWVGRALPAWISPMLLPDPNATVATLDAIAAQHSNARRIHLAVLGLLATVLVVGAYLGNALQ